MKERGVAPPPAVVALEALLQRPDCAAARACGTTLLESLDYSDIWDLLLRLSASARAVEPGCSSDVEAGGTSHAGAAATTTTPLRGKPLAKDTDDAARQSSDELPDSPRRGGRSMGFLQQRHGDDQLVAAASSSDASPGVPTTSTGPAQLQLISQCSGAAAFNLSLLPRPEPGGITPRLGGQGDASTSPANSDAAAAAAANDAAAEVKSCPVRHNVRACYAAVDASMELLNVDQSTAGFNLLASRAGFLAGGVGASVRRSELSRLSMAARSALGTPVASFPVLEEAAGDSDAEDVASPPRTAHAQDCGSPALQQAPLQQQQQQQQQQIAPGAGLGRALLAPVKALRRSFSGRRLPDAPAAPQPVTLPQPVSPLPLPAAAPPSRLPGFSATAAARGGGAGAGGAAHRRGPPQRAGRAGGAGVAPVGSVSYRPPSSCSVASTGSRTGGGTPGTAGRSPMSSAQRAPASLVPATPSAGLAWLQQQQQQQDHSGGLRSAPVTPPHSRPGSSASVRSVASAAPGCPSSGMSGSAQAASSRLAGGGSRIPGFSATHRMVTGATSARGGVPSASPRMTPLGGSARAAGVSSAKAAYMQQLAGAGSASSGRPPARSLAGATAGAAHAAAGHVAAPSPFAGAAGPSRRTGAGAAAPVARHGGGGGSRGVQQQLLRRSRSCGSMAELATAAAEAAHARPQTWQQQQQQQQQTAMRLTQTQQQHQHQQQQQQHAWPGLSHEEQHQKQLLTPSLLPSGGASRNRPGALCLPQPASAGGVRCPLPALQACESPRSTTGQGSSRRRSCTGSVQSDADEGSPQQRWANGPVAPPPTGGATGVGSSVLFRRMGGLLGELDTVIAQEQASHARLAAQHVIAPHEVADADELSRQLFA